MIFHKSNYGMFGKAFIADLNGQVGTSSEDVMKLNWPEQMTRDEIDDIAEANRILLDMAENGLTAWRGSQP